jgi:hypothetical protein
VAKTSTSSAGRSAPKPGKVHVFLGPVTGELAAHEADLTLLGEAWGDRAGAAIAVGDFDGSGLPDLAVGAPGATTAAGPEAGRVYVWFDPVL